MFDGFTIPRSAKDEIEGLPYFLRMCHKIRLHAAGQLAPEYHKNLGKILDLYTCQLLQIEYVDIVHAIVEENLGDNAALHWAYENGARPDSNYKKWWSSYVRNLGFRDDLSERLAERKKVAGFEKRDDICSFFDFMDADEGRP